MKLVLLVLFTFIVILIYIPVFIKIEIKRKNHDDIINVKATLLKGLIKFNYEISYIDLVTKDKSPLLKIRRKLEEKNTEKELLRKESVLKYEDIIEIYNNIKKYSNTFNKIIHYILKKIHINSLSLSTTIGLGDAALTGIAYGVLWTIIGTLLNILLNYKEIKDIKDMNISIYPNFNESILEVDFFCIIKLKIVHIIIAGFKGIKVFIKGGVLNV
ncbi:DUF2953 domain-containing protein [Proteiniborus sp. MB09-C3]|uniref:DUF2953 domain-containing protein n=1 Tax=Proteiniborus sp. MB09-C3 TaxID=3050072 RepID=UPI002557322B|nr:DUF2953 domain-containing protein [Proteiniborus sp. MB09-C3]WIV10969.1 DUF2953 domain-containing protein [Proteiniborus sp. MB09-C3]